MSRWQSTWLLHSAPFSTSERLSSYPGDALGACIHPSPCLIAIPVCKKVVAAQLWQPGAGLWSGSITRPV